MEDIVDAQFRASAEACVVIAWSRFSLLRRLLFAAFASLALLSLGTSPAFAHRGEKHQQQQQQAAQPGAAQAPGPSATGMHASMGEMMDHEREDRAPLSTFERLLDWLGRTHPVIVHFPIAFFPAALFTAIVGRRRPAFGAPVQFLVVAGGMIAPIAALFGWFNGGWSLTDTDPLVAVHRWLGTFIGIGGLGLAIWAARRPDQDRSAGMIVALSVMTAAIVVQGWYGGAIVHGIDHMNW